MLIIFALFGAFVQIEGGPADPETGEGTAQTFKISQYEVGDFLPELFSYDEAIDYVNSLNFVEGYLGYDGNTRRVGMKYVIPTRDEWYRAAYWHQGWTFSPHGNTFPRGQFTNYPAEANFIGQLGIVPWGYVLENADYVPVNSYSNPWGLYNIAGNAWEWNEEGIMSGGNYFSDRHELSKYYPGQRGEVAGLRVAIVPELQSIFLLLIGCVFAIITQRRKE